MIASACSDGPVGPAPGFRPDPDLEAAAASITPASIARRVGVLAHDSLQGRGTPSPGLEAAAHYLAGELALAGLEPAGTSGYTHRFDFTHTVRDPTQPLVVELDGGGGPVLIHGMDFVVAGSAAGDAVGTLVWGGPAESADTVGLDLKGAVVLYDLPITRFDARAVGHMMQAQLASALGEAAAEGYVVSQGFTESELARLEEITRTWSFERPLFFITEPAAVSLLGAAGLDLATLRVQPPQALAPRIHVQGALASETVALPNVAGLLRGSDPALRDEYVVVTAHFDHLGTGPPDASGDFIHNGADDNASGTAAVLAMASALKSLKSPPARSVLFLLVSAEERGLVGTRRYMDSPTVPVDAMVANINLDMIGRNGPGDVFAVGHQYSSLGPLISSLAEDVAGLGLDVIADDQLSKSFYGRSDNWVFACAGIPALFIHSGLHDDYHGPDDEADRLDNDKAARVARLALYLTHQTADVELPPAWTAAGQALVTQGTGCRQG